MQIQQSDSRRAEACFQHNPARLLPTVGQLIRLNARHGEVVGLLNEFEQALHGRRVGINVGK